PRTACRGDGRAGAATCARLYPAARDRSVTLRALGCGIVAFRGDLPERLLEHRVRLAARDQVLAVDDDGRDRVDAEPVPELLGLPHFLGVLVPLEHRARPLDRQADSLREL